MLSDDISEFMTSTIQIYPLLSKNKFGESIYGSPVDVNCLIVETIEQIIDKNNEKVDSKTKLFIDGNIDIEYSSKIVFNGLSPLIKWIKKLPDENGIYSKIIYI